MTAICRFFAGLLFARDPLIERAASLIPSLFKPDLLPEGPLEDISSDLLSARVLDFVKTVSGFNVDNQKINRELVIWLEDFQPQIVRVQRILIDLKPYFTEFAPRQAELGDLHFSQSLGPLAVYGHTFARTQQVTDSLWRNLLPRDLFETDSLHTIWQHVVKASVIAAGLEDAASAQEMMTNLCDELVQPQLRFGNKFWISVCKSKSFRRLSDKLTAAELNLLFADRRGFVEFLAAGKAKATPAILANVEKLVPFEFDPINRYLCLRFKGEQVCRSLLGLFSSLTEQLDFTHARALAGELRNKLLEISDQDIPNTDALQTLPVPFLFEFADLELHDEYAQLSPDLMRILVKAACTEEPGNIWPGFERLLLAQNQSQLQLELQILAGQQLGEFLKVVRRNSTAPSSELRASLRQIDAQTLINADAAQLLRLADELVERPRDKVAVEECGICRDDDQQTPVCCQAGHRVCSTCVEQIVTQTFAHCPFCRRDFWG